MPSPLKPISPFTPRSLELNYSGFAPSCPPPVITMTYTDSQIGSNLPVSCGGSLARTGLTGIWTAIFTLTNNSGSALGVGPITIEDTPPSASDLTVIQDQSGALYPGDYLTFTVTAASLYPGGSYLGHLSIPLDPGGNCLINFALRW